VANWFAGDAPRRLPRRVIHYRFLRGLPPDLAAGDFEAEFAAGFTAEFAAAPVLPRLAGAVDLARPFGFASKSNCGSSVIDGAAADAGSATSSPPRFALPL
jgi:hypothetical protein